MNLRHQANNLLVNVQTSLSLGAWGENEDQVRQACDELEEALFEIMPMASLQPYYDKLSKLVGEGVRDSMSGSWISDRAEYPVSGMIVEMPHLNSRLAA